MLFADLDGQWAEDSPPATIPPPVLSTPLRPDLVVVENQNTMRILELTIPTNTLDGLRNARERKQNKPEYGTLLTDLETRGWNVSYDTIEIGSLGHFTKPSIETINDTLPFDCIHAVC